MDRISDPSASFSGKNFRFSPYIGCIRARIFPEEKIPHEEQ